MVVLGGILHLEDHLNRIIGLSDPLDLTSTHG